MKMSYLTTSSITVHVLHHFHWVPILNDHGLRFDISFKFFFSADINEGSEFNLSCEN